MTQEQVNNNIAEELNKWQPIFEYGRIFLDEDKALRDKYKWLIFLKKYLPWGFGLTVIEGILSFWSNTTFMYVVLGLFVLFIIVAIVIIYRNRITISKIVDMEKRAELEGLLELTNNYLSKLGRWLAELDSHFKVSSSHVTSIEKEFIEAKAIQLPNDNKFSMIHGNLNPEWVARAKDFADKRLQPLKQYIYE